MLMFSVTDVLMIILVVMMLTLIGIAYVRYKIKNKKKINISPEVKKKVLHRLVQFLVTLLKIKLKETGVTAFIKKYLDEQDAKLR